MITTIRKINLILTGLAMALVVGCGGPSHVATLKVTSEPSIEEIVSDGKLVPLRIIVNVPAEVILTWGDTGGRFQIGPLTDYVIPLPADGTATDIEVGAEGYLTYTTVITASQPLTITIELIPVTMGMCPGPAAGCCCAIPF